ncbi:MAG: prepilin-type N-terminal cleavage/methylation domain-containing protein [Limisphaerales bacterium]
MKTVTKRCQRKLSSAFTLMEVIVCTAILAIAVVSL